MYAAFGDKRGLFRSALDHYLSRLREKMMHLEATASPGQAITGFFEETVERSLDDTLQRGCMLVNSALEASPRDEEFRSAIANELTLIEDFFRSRVAAAQECGEISRACSPEDVARQLLALLLGVRVLARVRPQRPLLTGAVAQTLALLDLPPLATAATVSSSPKTRKLS
jgi:TetR/AcrR family transcriptional repressor of nem operon